MRRLPLYLRYNSNPSLTSSSLNTASSPTSNLRNSINSNHTSRDLPRTHTSSPTSSSLSTHSSSINSNLSMVSNNTSSNLSIISSPTSLTDNHNTVNRMDSPQRLE